MQPDATGTTVGGFVLGELLGRGGFGAVYRSRHPALAIDVAVKLIDVHALATDPERVLAEARLMARLDHPNLLRVLDAGASGAWVYLVLELMDGGSCKSERALPPAALLDAARQLLSGVQALHDARVLHRDIKPANLLRRAGDGRLKLADLGIAAEWRTAADYDRAGTLAYMAPELFEGAPRYSPATDLYAVGVTLAYMATKADPFPPAAVAGADAPVRTLDERPDLPPALAALVDRLRARDAAARPASAAEALAALAGTAAPAPVPASPGAEAETLVPAETPQNARRIGSWVLGGTFHDSANWHGCAAHHARTGHAARLLWLRVGGPIGHTTANILAAAERASRLNHPGIGELVDWGRHEGQAYVVTTPQGRDLGDLVSGGRPLDEPTAIAFMAALADALVYLHAEGLVYQLVEPGSVVLRADGRAVQFSWPVFCAPAGTSVAAVNGVSPRFYLPKFAPTEAFFGRRTGTIEPSVDTFGLGATFYYLLAGPEAYASAQPGGPRIGAQPVLPPMNARLARLLLELLSQDPNARPTAVQVRAELGTIARLLGVPLD